MTKRLTGLLSAIAMSVSLLAMPYAAHAGGVLRLDEVAVGEIDPAIASDYADSILMFNLYDTLVLPRQGGPGHVPHLASSWEGSGTRFTFNLRDDVKFVSGNRLTAADVVFSVERMKAIGKGHSHLFGVVESVTAVDDNTVRFNLNSPYSPFVASLVRLPIVDSKTLKANLGDDWGQAYLQRNTAGTGAYKLSSHNPQEETVMERNRDYFLGVPAAAPDTVRLRYGLEAATVRTLMAQGQHDIASQWLPPEVIKALLGEGAQIFSESGTGAFYVKMNTQKAPLDDVNCRLAFSKAFDYEAAVKLAAINDDVSTGSPSTGGIPVGMFGANPAGKTLKRDLGAARKHLADCKYDADSMNIEISWIAEVPLEERFALLMQANFAELGVDSTIRKLPWALFAEQVSKPENTPHISQLFINAVTGDPDTLLYGQYHSSVPGTWQSPEYLNDPEVDRLLEQGRTAPDDRGREAAYSALNKRLLAIAPSIYAYDRNSVFVASRRVKAPALTDPKKAFGLDGMGFSFRLMEVSN